MKLKNFIDLSKDEQLMILEWRNSMSVRMQMYDSEEISEKRHLKFIDYLNNTNSNQYFLIEEHDNNIGVAYLSNIKDSIASVGLYARPELRGVGKKLLTIICKYAFTNLNLTLLKIEVFKENKKAIRLYENFGFNKTDMVLLKGKEVICMELKNENRKF